MLSEIVNQKNNITLDDLFQTISITKIGVWLWNLQTDHVTYSDEWADIVGYEKCELKEHVSTWESMLLPEDLAIAENFVEKHLSGELPIYEAEFRMVKKDGTIIWGHDKGKVTQYTSDGKPLILCGVLQDITNIKLTEQKLRESTDILNLAIEVAEFGTWDWDLQKDLITYNDEYLKMLGYTQSEITGTLSEWENMNHPEDLIIVTKLLDDFVQGKSTSYECDIRMRHKNGNYIWTKDVGRIISKDENGNATRVLGGHLNIHNLKTSQYKLEKTLIELENHQADLEKQIEQRTKELIVQDHLLVTVNDISQKLLALDDNSSFDTTLTQCLKNLTLAYNTADFTLWRHFLVQGQQFFCMTHDYKRSRDKSSVYSIIGMESYIENQLETNGNFDFHIKEDGNVIINYSILPENARDRFEKEKTVTNITSDIEEEWVQLLGVSVDNCHSVLISFIYLYNNIFGFISTGNEMEGVKYSEAHENMIDICGKLFANAQKKHEMDEQLHYAHEEALLSSQAKTNFLANMSHEIRTPLNAILGMSEIILRESKGRATEDYAVEIKNASESLLTIINDILDISKIESGKIEIIELDYNITSLLNDVISLSKIRLKDRPVLFTTFIDSNLPAILNGDEIRIKQILLNLLSNAIKFTKKGNINFSAKSKLEGDIAVLELKVKDTGMGIKQEDMNRLFLQFERMDTTKNRNIEGTGLGLAITKQLCEMMGGTISVDSVWQKGTTFTATIPQKCINYEPIVKIENRKSVLIYEAREFYANSIKQTLNNLGCTCSVCTNQSSLVEHLSENSYDYLFIPAVHIAKIKSLKLKLQLNITIVLMTDPGDMSIYKDDLSIPLPISSISLSNIFNNNTSIQNEKTIETDFIAPDVKILIVDDNKVNLKVAKGLLAPYKFEIDTALNGVLAIEMIKSNVYDLVFMDHMMPEMDGVDATAAIRKFDDDYCKNLPIIARELFVKEGMNDFLAKPIEIQKLNEILAKWVPAHKRKKVEIVLKDDTDNIDLPCINGIDTKYGVKMIGGNIKDYNDVLQSFYSDGLTKVSKIHDAFTQKDYKTYSIDVHAIKSSAASIGAQNVSNLAKKLESAAISKDYNYIKSHTNDFLTSYCNLLDSIHEYIKQKSGDIDSTKEPGNIDNLKENIITLEKALADFDIDTIEQIVSECLAYNWNGKINELFVSCNEFVQSFEYYTARTLLDEIKIEMADCYDI